LLHLYEKLVLPVKFRIPGKGEEPDISRCDAGLGVKYGSIFFWSRSLGLRWRLNADGTLFAPAEAWGYIF
jgi:hypothetical protein